jgi:predicted ester cyclase
LVIEEMIAEGDLVAARYTERGKFVGPFLGHAPTGKSYQLVAMEWFVVKDGKIQRRWGARDAASQARQIGLPLS